MKTLFIIACLLGMQCMIAQTAPKTSTVTSVSVPETVRKAFITEFPTIQPKWELDNKNYKAIYADPKNNSKGIIVYDAEGKVIRRDIETNVTIPEE